MDTLKNSPVSSPWIEDVNISELNIDVSGTLLTQDPDTDFPDFLIINAAYGPGEQVAHGILCPDEYRVFKPFIDVEFRDAIVGQTLGSKELRELLVNDSANPIHEENTPFDEQHHFALLPDQIMRLAQLAKEIESESEKPLEIEWIHDKISDNFYIIKVTDLALTKPNEAESIVIYELDCDAPHILFSGVAIGSGITHGEVALVPSLASSADFVEGSILVTKAIDHHWLPLLKKAKGVITDRGGRASEGASICRRFGIPAILGSVHATNQLRDRQKITLDCSHSERGTAYREYLNFHRSIINLEGLPTTILNRRLSIDSPDAALQWWRLPSQGFGMAKIESIISDDIGIHPMALIRYHTLVDEHLRLKIDRLTAGYESRTEYFVDRLARSIATMAAVAYPDPAVIRLNDFTSENYRNLIDRGLLEPLEHNPKMGLRGATRYLSEDYQEAFELECQAIKRARDQMGFTNINIAIPFCRTVRQAKQVIQLLEANGLHRDREDLEIHLIAEVPSNIILAHQFLSLFDGLDIDLDILTQLVLSIDPQDVMAEGLYDHENAAVLSAIASLVEEAHSNNAQVTIFGLLEDHRAGLMKYLIEAEVDGFAFEPKNFVRGSHQIAEAEQLFFERIPEKTNPIMTTKQLQKFKKLLNDQRFQIVNQIHSQEEEEKILQRKGDDGFNDHGYDPAVELLEKLTNSEAQLVQKIDLALLRIDDKSYGICTACYEEIPLERLEAKPSVSLCRDCQSKHEENA